MKIIAWMIMRMILARFFLILAGISIFVVTLEVVTFARDILELQGDELSAVLKYFAFRLPIAVSTFLPISSLLAILLTFSELSYRNELPAIWNAGVSHLRLILALFPLGLLLGGLNFLISDQVIPKVAPTLHEWGIGDYGKKKLNLGGNDPLWMRAGNDIVRAGAFSAQATSLSDLIIFRRDPAGLLREQIHSSRAYLNKGRWELSDAIVYYRSNLPPSRVNRLIYSGDMRPAAAGARTGDPEEMSSADLSYFIENAGFGIRPAYVYQTWWNKRLTLFLSTFILIAITVPLVSTFRRGGGIGIFFAIGVGIGFVFFILDGITLTLGEIGIVPAWMAAWMPILTFSALAATLVLRAEEL
ncbi:MAG TPA: LptF/LptG family permease [Aestuariivirgaceae bacterium]|jgi:lipopolysaccharide export system permease protein